jgi:hypothetical protein
MLYDSYFLNAPNAESVTIFDYTIRKDLYYSLFSNVPSGKWIKSNKMSVLTWPKNSNKGLWILIV